MNTEDGVRKVDMGEIAPVRLNPFQATTLLPARTIHRPNRRIDLSDSRHLEQKLFSESPSFATHATIRSPARPFDVSDGEKKKPSIRSSHRATTSAMKCTRSKRRPQFADWQIQRGCVDLPESIGVTENFNTRSRNGLRLSGYNNRQISRNDPHRLDFVSQLLIIESAVGIRCVTEDRLTEARRFRQTNISADP